MYIGTLHDSFIKRLLKFILADKIPGLEDRNNFTRTFKQYPKKMQYSMTLLILWRP